MTDTYFRTTRCVECGAMLLVSNAAVDAHYPNRPFFEVLCPSCAGPRIRVFSGSGPGGRPVEAHYAGHGSPNAGSDWRGTASGGRRDEVPSRAGQVRSPDPSHDTRPDLGPSVESVGARAPTISCLDQSMNKSGVVGSAHSQEFTSRVALGQR